MMLDPHDEELASRVPSAAELGERTGYNIRDAAEGDFEKAFAIAEGHAAQIRCVLRVLGAVEAALEERIEFYQQKLKQHQRRALDDVAARTRLLDEFRQDFAQALPQGKNAPKHIDFGAGRLSWRTNPTKTRWDDKALQRWAQENLTMEQQDEALRIEVKREADWWEDKIDFSEEGDPIFAPTGEVMEVQFEAEPAPRPVKEIILPDEPEKCEFVPSPDRFIVGVLEEESETSGDGAGAE